MFILTIYELDDHGLQVHFQRATSDTDALKAAAVAWTAQRFPDHFEEGMFHDSPSNTIEDNYQAIILWSEYADNAGTLRFLLRPTD